MLELLPLVGIALLIWLIMIRPMSRRQKELGRMQSSLSVGDDVMLTSGVYGAVRELEDDHAMVEIAPGVTIKVARGAIGAITNQTDDQTGDQTDEQDLTDDQPGSTSGPEES